MNRFFSGLCYAGTALWLGGAPLNAKAAHAQYALPVTSDFGAECDSFQSHLLTDITLESANDAAN